MKLRDRQEWECGKKKTDGKRKVAPKPKKGRVGTHQIRRVTRIIHLV